MQLNFYVYGQNQWIEELKNFPYFYMAVLWRNFLIQLKNGSLGVHHFLINMKFEGKNQKKKKKFSPVSV